MASAGAADATASPHLWTRGFGAIALNPSGLLGDVAVEARAPVLRLGGVAFNDTFVGVGGRVGASPAHLDVAVRLNAQLIDLLPILVEVIHTSYWESPWGLVGTDQVVGMTGPGRAPLYAADLDFSGQMWAVSVMPTLQIRAGSFVAFTSWGLSWTRIRPQAAHAPWVYEPFRGMVLGFDDRLLETTSAVLWEPINRDDGALVRIGPGLRSRASAVTGDTTVTLGALMQWRPGPKAPTLLLLLSPYVVDPDLVGPVPYLAGLVSAERTDPLGRR